MEEQKQTCDICYQIRCRGCGWVANDEDVIKIQCGSLTACPVCGWQPQ